MYHPYFIFTVTAEIAVNEFAYTIMRLSQINVETAALAATMAVMGGTMAATKNVATIMRSRATNAEGDINAGPTNCESDML